MFIAQTKHMPGCQKSVPAQLAFAVHSTHWIKPEFRVALTHCNMTGGLLPLNALSYIQLGASIQPFVSHCVGWSGFAVACKPCTVFLTGDQGIN